MRFSKKLPEVAPEPTYSFEIFPDNTPDGEHEFDGIKVSFSKPGWQWIAFEHDGRHGRRLYMVGNGFPTRDAALVDLLSTARELELPNARDTNGSGEGAT